MREAAPSASHALIWRGGVAVFVFVFAFLSLFCFTRFCCYYFFLFCRVSVLWQVLAVQGEARGTLTYE